MTLAVFQETLKTLFISPEGEEALRSQESLEAFVKKTALSKEEQEFILSQSLERLEQYQYMLYANVKETLEAIFPFTQELIGDAWEDVAREYLYSHPPSSHHLIDSGELFPGFLEHYPALLNKYPFLLEMAAYEWVEAELLSAYNAEVPDGILNQAPQSSQEFLQYLPFINTTATFLNLNYAIPDIIEFLKHHNPSDLTLELTTPQTKLMWIYRLDKPYHCRFFELTPPLASWLATVFDLQQSGELLPYEATLAPIYEELAKIMPQLSREQFDHQFLSILAQLLENRILLGSIPI